MQNPLEAYSTDPPAPPQRSDLGKNHGGGNAPSNDEAAIADMMLATGFYLQSAPTGGPTKRPFTLEEASDPEFLAQRISAAQQQLATTLAAKKAKANASPAVHYN